MKENILNTFINLLNFYIGCNNIKIEDCLFLISDNFGNEHIIKSFDLIGDFLEIYDSSNKDLEIKVFMKKESEIKELRVDFDFEIEKVKLP